MANPFTLRFTAPGLTAVDSGVIQISSLGTQLNLAALPTGGAGVVPNVSAYTALNVPAMPAGTLYADPVTGVPILKCTSSTYPASGSPYWNHNYAEGPNNISGEISPGVHTIIVGSGDASTSYFIDVSRAGTVSNSRVAPQSVARVSFSNVAGQYHICYVHTGTQIRRFNTLTMAFQDTGNFPLTGQVWNGGSTGWFQHDLNDDWFAYNTTSSGPARAWQSSTGLTRSRTIGGGDNDVYLDLDGRYLSAGVSSAQVWDALNDIVTNVTMPALHSYSHVGSHRGYFLTQNTNSGGTMPMNRIPSNAPTATGNLGTNCNGYAPQFYRSGWVQPAGLGQRFLMTTLDSGTNPGVIGNSIGNSAIGYYGIDGTSFQKLLCHHYSKWTGATTANSYQYWTGGVFGQPSPDGKAVKFNSNMNNTSARGDSFVAFPPLI